VRWWRAPPHTSRALYVVYILHITTVASLWVAPHSTRRRWSISHELLQFTRGLGPRYAVAMHRPARRRAARAGGIACSTHCRDLERLPWCSPRGGTACLRHVPGNVACSLQQLPWGSPRVGTACLRHAPRSVPYHLEQTEAALVLTAPASAMRLAVERAALSCLEAALVLAAPASAMRHAVFRIT
jgi:hypothetical protein